MSPGKRSSAKSVLAPPFSKDLFPHDQYGSLLSYTLPAYYHKPLTHSLHSATDPASCLRDQFSLDRLNDIHKYLSLAGRIHLPARPLHHQLNLLNRQIVLVNQADLHLLWTSDRRLFLKPLPKWLLDSAFWERNLCADPELHECVSGFLMSWVWLVASEVDLRLAVEKGLMPGEKDGLTWKDWAEFVTSFAQRIDIDKQGRKDKRRINKRFEFGELRIGRLNSIYRFTGRGFLRGYHFGFNTYGSFLERNFAWVAVVFAYLLLVLTAMQTGLATSELENNAMFSAAAYGFVVFGLVVFLTIVGAIVTLVLVIACSNLVSTVANLIRKGGSSKDHSTEHV